MKHARFYMADEMLIMIRYIVVAIALFVYLKILWRRVMLLSARTVRLSWIPTAERSV